KLPGEVNRQLALLNSPPGTPAGYLPIYRIWPDSPVKGHMTKSISTVKAAAAHCSFSALGKDIVWAESFRAVVTGHKVSGPHLHQERPCGRHRLPPRLVDRRPKCGSARRCPRPLRRHRPKWGSENAGSDQWSPTDGPESLCLRDGQALQPERRCDH